MVALMMAALMILRVFTFVLLLWLCIFLVLAVLVSSRVDLAALLLIDDGVPP